MSSVFVKGLNNALDILCKKNGLDLKEIISKIEQVFDLNISKNTVKKIFNEIILEIRNTTPEKLTKGTIIAVFVIVVQYIVYSVLVRYFETKIANFIYVLLVSPLILEFARFISVRENAHLEFTLIFTVSDYLKFVTSNLGKYGVKILAYRMIPEVHQIFLTIIQKYYEKIGKQFKGVSISVLGNITYNIFPATGYLLEI
jgi:hypothetical protein